MDMHSAARAGWSRVAGLGVFLAVQACLVVPGWAEQGSRGARKGRTNVLLIIADDLRDYAGWMGGHPQSVTPNMDALARRGMRFSNAHCAQALCNPSRTSMLTGLWPSSSGVHGNEQDWRRSVALKGKATLPEHFRTAGWLTAAAGKVFHANHGGPEGRLAGWHGGRRGFERDAAWVQRFPEPGVQIPRLPVPTGRNFNGLDIWHWDWGGIPVEEAETDDGQVVMWAADFLRREQSQPFFLAVGLYRPHSPWYVPQAYFDALPPVEDIQLPVVMPGDLDDVPEEGKRHLRQKESDHERIVEHDLWRSAVRAYLANVRFCDAMLGKLMEALQQGPHAERTVVVFTSDHGWYLGEKQLWHKGRLWEEATRVPLTILAPRVTQADSVSDEAVSLVDVYPTLCELAGLKSPGHLDGQSLVPLLKQPNGTRERPALTFMGAGSQMSVSARGRRYRYTRYAGGGEELYDHDTDAKEWHNLSQREDLKMVKAELARWFPENWVHASRSVTDLAIAPRVGGGADLELMPGDVFEAEKLPDVRGCGVLVEALFELNPEVDGDSVLVSHGRPGWGYAVHLQDRKLTLTVRWGGQESKVQTHRLGTGRHHVRALLDGDGVMSIAEPGKGEMLGLAPFPGGFPEGLKGELSVAGGFGVLTPESHPNTTPFDGEVIRLRLTFMPGMAEAGREAKE